VKSEIQTQLEQIRDEMQRQHAEMQQQIQDLKEQLVESRRQITLTQQSAATTAQVAESSAKAAQQALSSSDQAAATLQTAVTDLKASTVSLAATVAEDQTKTRAAIGSPDKLHYKAVTLTPGGFLAAESVWRQHEMQSDIGTPFNSIPFDGTAFSNLSEFRMSARQTRLNILAESNTGSAKTAGYFEIDLFGAGLTSNSNESNSYMPRVRHAWIQSTWNSGWSVAGGQMWTLAQSTRKGITSFSSNAYLPDIIDAQYVVGLNWLRQPSLRVVRNFNNRISIAASAEGAQTMFSARNAPSNFLYCSPGTSTLTSTVNYSFDKAPDLLAKVAIDPRFGHYEIKAVVRFFRDRVYPGTPPAATAAYNSNSLGEAWGAAASWNIAKKLDISLNALAGQGIGRYGTSQLPDVTVRLDGSLAPIKAGQGLGMVEFNPNARLKLYAYGGSEYAGRTWSLNSAGKGVGYGSPLNNNTGCDTESVPTTSSAPLAGLCNADTRSIYQLTSGFWYRAYVGPGGRVQYGMQYSYTERNAWAGLGIAPKGDENMVFTSMRYYLP
jgi:hypothetical protein